MTNKHSAGEQEIRKLLDTLQTFMHNDDPEWATCEITIVRDWLIPQIAEAKLAGELAAKQVAAEIVDRHYPQGYAALQDKTVREIRALTPDSDGVLERIKRAERARGAEDVILPYRRTLELIMRRTGEKNTSSYIENFLAEQAAIADGKGEAS